MSQTIRKFVIGTVGGLGALVLSACDDRTPFLERPENYVPHRTIVQRGDRSAVKIVRRSSYNFQTSEETYKTVLEAIDFEEERSNFQIYRGKITSVIEKEGNILSALLAIAGREEPVSLSLGEGSYIVTDKFYEENHTGLFDTRGKPLPKEKCQIGDDVTAICWKKDFPWGDQAVNEQILKIPVRAFGNQNRNLYRCSAELLRYFRLGDDVMY